VRRNLSKHKWEHVYIYIYITHYRSMSYVYNVDIYIIIHICWFMSCVCMYINIYLTNYFSGARYLGLGK
jgi:hypothetical protein